MFEATVGCAAKSVDVRIIAPFLETLFRESQMRAAAIAQPNIALVKYWGKRDTERNLPAVGSLSITLDALWTTMDVDFASGASRDSLVLNNQPDSRLLPRVSSCLDVVAGVDRPPATVTSHCNFPIAAGLASSASAFAALVVAAGRATGRQYDRLALARLAGRASGSAARSLYGGFVELLPGGDDISLIELAGPADWPLEVIVAVTATGEKPVSSGVAMRRSAETSPFYRRWVDDQDVDLEDGRQAVVDRDFDRLAEIAEHNCLKMHSVMWTSRPSIVYWNDVTIACMQAVRSLREAGRSVFFTIDAGPQVKAVCLPGDADTVADALAGVEGVVDVMRSGLGDGARVTSAE
jgi:diphosphomevalonate decarboxylase